MPSSVADICNRALSEIGAQSTIASLDEESQPAVYCKLWYDNIRQGLLRAATWSFARRQVVLAELGNLADATSPYPWLYKYQYPSDCLKFRYVLAPPFLVEGAITPPQVGVGIPGLLNLAPSRQNRWLINGEVDPLTGVNSTTIVSNVIQAIGVYTADVTDVNQFDTLFESALTSALSYKLCMPLSGNVGMRDSFRLQAEGSILHAQVASGNEALATTDHVVDWVAARGAPSPWALGFGNGACGLDQGWGSWFGSNDAMSWGA